MQLCSLILQEKYNAWRMELEKRQREQPTCTGFLWDCAFAEARKSFTEYIGAKEQIPFEHMLFCEMKYEENAGS